MSDLASRALLKARFQTMSRYDDVDDREDEGGSARETLDSDEGGEKGSLTLQKASMRGQPGDVEEEVGGRKLRGSIRHRPRDLLLQTPTRSHWIPRLLNCIGFTWVKANAGTRSRGDVEGR